MPDPYIAEFMIAQDCKERPSISTMDDKTAEIIEDGCKFLNNFFITRFERLAISCESPIERQLLATLMVWENHRQNAPRWFGGDYDPSQKSPHHVTGYVQAKIGAFRADLMIVVNNPPMKIVIECDGHDFHERTKQQAARDRSRDRWMTANGYKVQRFTGAEIFADPHSCVQEIMEILHKPNGGKK